MAPTSTSEMDPNFSEYFPAQIFPNKPTVACTSPRISSSEQSHSCPLPSRWRRPSPLYPESDAASKGEYGIGVSHKKTAWAPSVATPSSSQVGEPLPPAPWYPVDAVSRWQPLSTSQSAQSQLPLQQPKSSTLTVPTPPRFGGGLSPRNPGVLSFNPSH